MNLGMEVGLGPGHIVLDGDPAPPSQKEHSLPFLAHVCYDQTTGWIKMSLGTMIGLGPGHIALDGDPATPKRGTARNIRPISTVAKRLPISANAEHLFKMAVVRHLGFVTGVFGPTTKAV